MEGCDQNIRWNSARAGASAGYCEHHAGCAVPIERGKLQAEARQETRYGLQGTSTAVMETLEETHPSWRPGQNASGTREGQLNRGLPRVTGLSGPDNSDPLLPQLGFRPLGFVQ